MDDAGTSPRLRGPHVRGRRALGAADVHDHAGLARHVGHCVTRETPYGPIVTKDAADSPRKIDAAVAAIVAYDRAAWHANQPKRTLAFAWA